MCDREKLHALLETEEGESWYSRVSAPTSCPSSLDGEALSRWLETGVAVKLDRQTAKRVWSVGQIEDKLGQCPRFDALHDIIAGSRSSQGVPNEGTLPDAQLKLKHKYNVKNWHALRRGRRYKEDLIQRKQMTEAERLEKPPTLLDKLLHVPIDEKGALSQLAALVCALYFTCCLLEDPPESRSMAMVKFVKCTNHALFACAR